MEKQVMKDVMLELKGCSFSYEGQESPLIDDLSVSLERGKTYAIIGPSGCGKTTLLNLMAQFIQPQKGALSWNGSGGDQEPAKIGYLFQKLALFPWQRVRQALEMPLKIAGIRSDHQVDELLEEVGIGHLAHAYPATLSGGEQQRLAFARTLIAKPDLLLMDEPTSALDKMTKETIQNLILKEQVDRAFTMVLVTHDIEEAAFLGQEVWLMKGKGQLQRLENPFFGREDVRNSLEFYKYCIELRKSLEGGGHKDEV